MRLLQALAFCVECDKTWDSRNALGVAAQHNQRTGHEVAVEMTYSHRFKGPAVKPPKKKDA